MKKNNIFIFIIFVIFNIIKLDNLYCFDIDANYGIIIDYDTNEVIFEKNADEITIPSSMTKIMTAYVIFDMIDKDMFKIDDKFKVSIRAWRQDGTRMFLEPEWKVSVDDLLNGLLVVSGNDAAVALAEGSSGSIQNFVDIMNETAKKLNLKKTNFTNPNGLYDNKHYMSVRDLSTLAKALIDNHKEYYYKYFSNISFSFNNISQRNKNWLLLEYDGADGIKTGFTDQGKYSMVASATKNNKRIIAVINGANSERERINQVKTMFNYAFKQYDYIELYKKNDKITELSVLYNKKKKIEVYTKEDVVYSTKKDRIQNIKVQLIYKKYISAPIKADDNIAQIKILDGEFVKTYKLYAKNNVEIYSKFEKFKTLFKYNIKKILYHNLDRETINKKLK